MCGAAAGGKPQTGFVDRYIDRDADGGDNQSFASLDYPRAHVTQMLGSLSSANSLTDSPEICRMMAERLGCAYSLLPAPLIMGSAEVAQAVRSRN